MSIDDLRFKIKVYHTVAKGRIIVRDYDRLRKSDRISWWADIASASFSCLNTIYYFANAYTQSQRHLMPIIVKRYLVAPALYVTARYAPMSVAAVFPKCFRQPL